VIDLTRFSIDNIIAKLKEINPAINWAHSNPFPKEESRPANCAGIFDWLSRYQFHPQFIQVNDDGSVRGGLSQLVASIIDFSFVRSVSADAYSIFGAPCYDPVSLFVLDLCRYLDKIADSKHFCSILRDAGLGQSYRTLAGLRDDAIAESARGVSPRAAHRTGRKPLDLSGSCHPVKAAAFRQNQRVHPVAS